MSYASIAISVLDHAHVITLNRPETGNRIDGCLLRELDDALDHIERAPQPRVVVLQGQNGVFCTGRDLEDSPAPDERMFARYMATLRRLASLSRITICSVDGQAIAGGVGLVAACDLVVATPRAQFSLPEALWGLLPACVTPYLIRRVGFQQAYRLAMTTLPVTAERAREMYLVDELADAPDATIRQWARRLTRLDPATLGEAKRFFRRMWIITGETEAAAVAEIERLAQRPEVADRVRAVLGPRAAGADDGRIERSPASPSPASPSQPPPPSSPAVSAVPALREVVHVQRRGPIATVIMEDRDSKNTFSCALVQGLRKAFSDIRRDPELRVVVVHGYDSYFCCGGTREELLRIHAGEAVFTDGEIHDLLLRCEIPVIAAMQGHALGGGLAFGSFADHLVMARQSLYSANFLKYGFTPGFGSTFILPRRFGDVLGREMLFTARNYHGAELKERGAGAAIVERADVIATAMKLAEELADKPRIALITLKQHMTASIADELGRCLEAELRMHEITFPRPEVRERIDARFDQ